ncbi:hypothetical protein [Nitrosomonas sp.]|uniref:hypothetical protein n=1 Tax=Nitrosomonas sp. TaxID=42353 RepID=UPI0025D617A0|nr:hypothetical protein [Nitrosomonas sp.]
MVIDDLNPGGINPKPIRKILNKLLLFIANTFIFNYKATGYDEKQSATSQMPTPKLGQRTITITQQYRVTHGIT